ncbi:UvrD-helicase domain-containing protein [Shewanella gelidii]|uniref:RecBCD enzyme subunit RecB n=1 Tax=Shewanella gelidii TaxID=1642821 RepID=A0A917JY70_9GAMM|nr:UvrD-helicase domain-containing protein [Shewanella gelidii]MCL1098166.1 UvrD-helicase domain-containing protein [Shewanella gelidii]GGI91088.1 RecBCD enzyme subunit RecB [Shewanella gelidii]
MSKPTPQHTARILDPMTMPLYGKRLIEASAGTGKTYTISGLYLRLLLGIDEHAALRTEDKALTPEPAELGQALSCEQILVVTFTNAATEELRDRIRKRINLAHQKFMGLTVSDPFIEHLYNLVPNSERMQALRRLDLALKSLDEAAIFTIHSFCQRMLSDLAFESNLLFESEFTLDDSEFLHHAVRDFWREACYSQPLYVAQIVQQAFGEPSKLVQQLRPLLGNSQAKANVSPVSFSKLVDQLNQCLSRLRIRWPRERDATLERLKDLPLNASRFGKKADNYPKLDAVFDQLDNWCTGPLRLPDTKALDNLRLDDLRLNKGGVTPTPQQAPLLAHIQELANLIGQIGPSFLLSALDGIGSRFRAQKHSRNVLSPDDLLSTLCRALEDDSSKELSRSIVKRFPVALIDEFQDTDPYQFNIFNQIYSQAKPEQHGLLMIGDPKQAIYAFRGADIYTYIHARQNTRDHYSLDTNYRSTNAMVNAVNQVFTLQTDPFISQQIPFVEVKAAALSNKQIIDCSSKTDPSAMRIRLLAEDPDKGLNKSTARAQLAFDAANEIATLLNQAERGQCQIQKQQSNGSAASGTKLLARDICVLVRDRNEAGYIRQALSERNIGSVFLSRESVFNTLEAKELALILKAMAMPKDERALRSAMATELLGYQAHEIMRFNIDEETRQTYLEMFHYLNQLWLNRGIMPALMQLAKQTQLINRLLLQHQNNQAPTSNASANNENSVLNTLMMTQSTGSGERRLTDFRHLSELLQNKATELDGINALLNWFEQSLLKPSPLDEQQLRLESEQNLVQVVTIHKSKGLEYPICFVPFISLARDSRRKPTPMLYHETIDEQETLVWDVAQSNDGWAKAKQEILAEDLRLLYVALTRPVYRCYLYIANHSKKLKAGISSQLCETAIGYLLGIQDKQCDYAELNLMAQKLASQATSVAQIEPSNFHVVAFESLQQEESKEACQPQTLQRQHNTPWRVGSYSGLVKNLGHEKVKPGADDESYAVSENHSPNSVVASTPQPEIASHTGGSPKQDHENAGLDDEDNLNRFNFERGANAGSFMHLVLELIDFQEAETDLSRHLPDAMLKYGVDQSWLEVLHAWYIDILATPLAQHLASQPKISLDKSNQKQAIPLSLAALSESNKFVEMEFYLPVKALHAERLNQLLAQFGYSHDLDFSSLQGMLKGFIDLSFYHQGQYFIADYKSNHLGDSFASYQQHDLHLAIRSHRYDLQYILYTLAMHRFLRQRLPNYDYQKHIGGCYYLFLRGMSASAPQNGIYFDKPPQALILALDELFEQGTCSLIPSASEANHDDKNDQPQSEPKNTTSQLELGL